MNNKQKELWNSQQQFLWQPPALLLSWEIIPIRRNTYAASEDITQRDWAPSIILIPMCPSGETIPPKGRGRPSLHECTILLEGQTSPGTPLLNIKAPAVLLTPCTPTSATTCSKSKAMLKEASRKRLGENVKWTCFPCISNLFLCFNSKLTINIP